MTASATPAGQAISRFAQSPTGRLHLGHAYSAVQARARAGRFVLRIEDIDAGRCRPDYVDPLLDDLHWLGLEWDALIVQSERAEAHRAALDRLIADGLAYRCVCTRADIAASAGAPQGEAAPLYPGTCRRVPVGADDQRPAAWRLDMAEAVRRVGELSWHDEVRGEVRAEPEGFGDVVIARKDAGTSYHLAATVDDAADGVTLVMRGRDLFAATHVHRLLQTLLGLPTPLYRHHPLVLGPDGRRLAKRTPGATLSDLREAGIDGRALVVGLLAGRLPVGFRLDDA